MTIADFHETQGEVYAEHLADERHDPGCASLTSGSFNGYDWGEGDLDCDCKPAPALRPPAEQGPF